MGPETCTHATFIIERVTKCAFAYVKNLRLNLEFICWLFLSCALFNAKLYRKNKIGLITFSQGMNFIVVTTIFCG